MIRVRLFWKDDFMFDIKSDIVTDKGLQALSILTIGSLKFLDFIRK